MKYHLTPVTIVTIKSLQITNIVKDVKKRESLYTVGGNVNWYHHYGKQYRGSSKNKIELSKIPLLGISEKN